MSRRTSILMALATFLIAMTLISAAANAPRSQEPTPAPPPAYELTLVATTPISEPCELRAYQLVSTLYVRIVTARVFVTVCANTATVEKSK
jgi:hypothetical protein